MTIFSNDIHALVQRDSVLSQIKQHGGGKKCDFQCKKEKEVIRKLLRYIQGCKTEVDNPTVKDYKITLSSHEIKRIKDTYL